MRPVDSNQSLMTADTSMTEIARGEHDKFETMETIPSLSAEKVALAKKLVNDLHPYKNKSICEVLPFLSCFNCKKGDAAVEGQDSAQPLMAESDTKENRD